MNKNLLSMGIICLCSSLAAPESLLAQTCTTNTSGSFTTTSNWTCSPGFTYLTAATLNVQNAMTVSSVVTLSSLQALNIVNSGSLTFGNNNQLIITNDIPIYLASPSNTISGPNNSSNYFISINNVPVWGKNAGGTGCTGTLTGQGRLTSATPCTVVAGAPLPLELVAFNATQSGNKAIVSFTTAQEKNIAGFIVERGTDGKTFTSVSNFISARNTVASQTYEWTDDQPQAGNNYYRLKTKEFDNTYSYSNTAVVNIKTDHSQPVLYPNPAKEQLTLDLGTSANTVVSIRDLLGRQYTCPSAGDGSVLNINVAALQPGNYVIQLTGKQQPQYLRFAKY
ncbi:T9SS type A sorting domain-containing protein [Chitinophagaceae bacterium MMS25-I14]